MQVKRFLYNTIKTLAFTKFLLKHLKFLLNVSSLYSKNNDEIFIVANGTSLQNDILAMKVLLPRKMF